MDLDVRVDELALEEGFVVTRFLTKLGDDDLFLFQFFQMLALLPQSSFFQMFTTLLLPQSSVPVTVGGDGGIFDFIRVVTDVAYDVELILDVALDIRVIDLGLSYFSRWI